MSGIVSTIAKSATSFLINKARDVTANRLSDGDLTDEKFRGMIVRDIEDIKSKLDAMSKKDLLSSLSFFKEGIKWIVHGRKGFANTRSDNEKWKEYW